MAEDDRSVGEQRDRGSAIRPPAWEFLVFYLLLVAGCLVVMVTMPDFRGEAFLGLIVSLALAPIGLRGSAEAEGSMTELADQVHEMSEAIHEMVNEAGLSEAAKRVIHRRQERDLLCRAIEQDITDHDWDAAMILVKELAERFGYRKDAEGFRARIERGRAETYEEAVTRELASLDERLENKQWIAATEEAARIQRLYPDSPRVENLLERVDRAHNRYKLDLERRFLHAAQREETEQAMELLRELDHYLSEEEAAQFREVARGVIGKARDNLGVRFKLLVQDKAWSEALTVGEEIIREFPNSRMAGEVRQMLDVLRERSGGDQAGVSASST
jgi:hypothetical protein